MQDETRDRHNIVAEDGTVWLNPREGGGKVKLKEENV